MARRREREGGQGAVDAEHHLAEFAAIVASSTDAIIGKTLEGIVTSWNAGAERMYGYTADEMVGLSIETIVPTDKRPELKQIIERLAAGEVTSNLITERQRKDGTRITVAVSISPIAGPDGTLRGAATIARDITEALRTQTALAESEALTRSVIDSALDAVIVIDTEGVISEFNPGAVAMFGIEAEDAVGRVMVDLIVPPSLRERHRQGFARCVATGKGRIMGQRVELSALRADGTEFPIELAITQVSSRGKAMFTGFVRDLTEVKQTQHALAQSEESYRVLFERHPTPIWLYDPESLRFLAVNEQALATYGYSRDEFLGMTIEQIRPEEDVEELHEATSDLTRGRVEPKVWRHRKKDGSLIEVQIDSHQVEFEGRPARVVMARDVTDQRRLEQQFRQAQKMDAIGNLAGGVAHDFNNILLVIRGLSSILLEQLDGESKQRVLEIDIAARRAAELTQQLLAFSRRQVLRPETVDLNDVVSETLALFGRLIGEDVVIVDQLSPKPQPVLVDRSQLQQVILNLLVNARDAISDGGTVIVRTSSAELDELYAAERLEVEPGSYAALEVTDTGKGMDAATRSRVFDPFFTTKETGTGLGLATAYGILKQSGGHIGVYSEPGIGTTFRVYLPLTNQVVEAKPTTVAAPSNLLGDETLLVVEDAEAVRHLVVELLRAKGYEVLAAQNGTEALELARERRDSIALLITDVVMPGMNGRELAERLAAESPGVKTLFMSGYPADTVVQHGITEARFAFIQKPYSADDLLRAVRHALDD